MMSIIERKDRHKKDLRKRILAAAKVLFLQEGYEGTSIRKIASAIEYSPTTIYLYYREKNAILLALQKEGFKLLRSKFLLLNKVDNPLERLKVIGRSYLQFALENPDFYELMFVMKEPLKSLEKGLREEWDDGKKVVESLVFVLEDCQQKGYFTGQDPYHFSIMVWSQVHGLAVLCLHGHLSYIAKEEMAGMPVSSALVDAVFERFVQYTCMEGNEICQ